MSTMRAQENADRLSLRRKLISEARAKTRQAREFYEAYKQALVEAEAEEKSIVDGYVGDLELIASEI